MLKKNWLHRLGLYLALGVVVCSMSACSAKEIGDDLGGEASGKEVVADAEKGESADEKNILAELIEEATKEIWVNTKITVYDSEDTSLTPRTMTEMTYDEEGRLLTRYVTDYVMAQEPFVKESEEYEYDENGNVLKSLSINEVYGLARFETYRYDENGNKTVYMGDDSTVVFYEYDEHGLLVVERAHIADPAAMGDRTWAMDNPGDVRKEVLYTYNDAGQLIEKREPSDYFEDNWFEYFYRYKESPCGHRPDCPWPMYGLPWPPDQPYGPAQPPEGHSRHTHRKLPCCRPPYRPSYFLFHHNGMFHTWMIRKLH